MASPRDQRPLRLTNRNFLAFSTPSSNLIIAAYIKLEIRASLKDWQDCVWSAGHVLVSVLNSGRFTAGNVGNNYPMHRHDSKLRTVPNYKATRITRYCTLSRDFFLIKDSAFLFKSDFFSYFSLFMLHKLIRTCHKQLKCRTVWLAVANLLTLLWRVSMLTCNIDTGILSVRYLLFFSLSRSGIVSKRLDISSLHCSQSA